LETRPMEMSAWSSIRAVNYPTLTGVRHPVRTRRFGGLREGRRGCGGRDTVQGQPEDTILGIHSNGIDPMNRPAAMIIFIAMYHYLIILINYDILRSG